jgi:hypothetical protein
MIRPTFTHYAFAPVVFVAGAIVLTVALAIAGIREVLK